MTPDACAMIHARAFAATRAWSTAEFAALMASPGAILTGDEAAFVLGRVTVDEAEVLTIATDPPQQRRGLARAALVQFEVRARAAGAASVFLEVAEDNVAAQSLYASTGYAQVGRRPRYYTTLTGNSIAALILRKQL